MTTTKTLIEAATLTEEEIHNLLPVELRNFTVDGLPYSPSGKDVATAARDKALWAVQEHLAKGNPIRSGSIVPLMNPGWHMAYRALAEFLERTLIEAGIERPHGEAS